MSLMPRMHGWPFIWFGFQVMRSKGCMLPILVHLALGCIATGPGFSAMEGGESEEGHHPKLDPPPEAVAEIAGKAYCGRFSRSPRSFARPAAALFCRRRARLITGTTISSIWIISFSA